MGRSRLTPAAVAAAIALGVTGCGGGSDEDASTASATNASEQTTTRGGDGASAPVTAETRAFRRAASRICTRAAQEVAALQVRDISPESNTRYAHARRAIHDDALAALARLDAPEPASASFGELRTALRERVVGMEDAQLRMDDRGVDLAALVRGYEEQEPRIAGLAAEAGIPACHIR